MGGKRLRHHHCERSPHGRGASLAGNRNGDQGATEEMGGFGSRASVARQQAAFSVSERRPRRLWIQQTRKVEASIGTSPGFASIQASFSYRPGWSVSWGKTGLIREGFGFWGLGGRTGTETGAGSEVRGNREEALEGLGLSRLGERQHTIHHTPGPSSPERIK